MATDINAIASGLPINNGSIIMTCYRTGSYTVNSEPAINVPIIANIQTKFDNRFDDPSYYFGGSTDGGTA